MQRGCSVPADASPAAPHRTVWLPGEKVHRSRASHMRDQFHVQCSTLTAEIADEHGSARATGEINLICASKNEAR